MPTFYEGAPILEASFKIDKELYIESCYKEETSKSILKRKEFKGGLCISFGMLFAVNILNFYRNYNSFFVPVIMMAVFFMFAWFFIYVQPSEIKKLYAKSYETNKFLSLSQKATLYRDSMIYENEFEKFSLYYTDFDFCTEDENAVIFKGARRDILIINKENLSLSEKEKLSEALFNAFASKYKRIK